MAKRNCFHSFNSQKCWYWVAAIQEPHSFDLGVPPSCRASKPFTSRQQMGGVQTRHRGLVIFIHLQATSLFCSHSASENSSHSHRYTDRGHRQAGKCSLWLGSMFQALVHTRRRICISVRWLAISATLLETLRRIWLVLICVRVFPSVLVHAFWKVIKIGKENPESKCKNYFLESTKMGTGWDRRR